MKPSLRGLNDYLITKAVGRDSEGTGGLSLNGVSAYLTSKPLKSVRASTAI